MGFGPVNREGAMAEGTVQWTEYVGRCQMCGWAFRVSAEFIADFREEYEDEGLTDRQVAETAEYCLQCSCGPERGERLPIGEQVRSATKLWAREAELVLSRPAVVFVAGGNMGGDADWDGLPVEDGRFYVAGRFSSSHPGDVGSYQVVSGPFDDSRAAVLWAQEQGFAKVESGVPEGEAGVAWGEFADPLGDGAPGGPVPADAPVRVRWMGFEWALEQTGGNCTAYVRREDHGEWLVVARGEQRAPEPGEVAELHYVPDHPNAEREESALIEWAPLPL